MLDSDTIPVDHAGNSETGAKFKGPPLWVIGMIAPPVLGTGAAYAQSNGNHQTTLIGLGAGVGLSVVWVAWLALKDARRVSLARQLQDQIEDAWTSHAKGESQRAEELLKECVKLAGSKLGRYDLVTLACLHTLGNLYRLREDHAGANSCYEQALPIYQKTLPRTHPARASFHAHRAMTFISMGNLEEAMREAQESVTLYRECGGQEFALADACSLVGRLANQRDENELALQSYSEALELVRRRLPIQDPRVLSAMGNLCRIYVKLRMFHESEKFLVQLVAEHRAQPDLQPENHLDALLDLAWTRLEQGRAEECEPLLVEALELLQTRVGPKERPLQKVLDAYKRITQDSVAAASTTHGLVNLMLVFCGEREKLRQTLEKFPLWMNARDATGWGPLHWATFVGRDDIVRWLLQKGAEVSRPEDRVHPLHVAAAWGKRESLLELLDAGADLNARDPRGWTPLFWCAFAGKTKLMEALIKRGADVNLRDDHGRTPLHVAAEAGHLSTVAALVGSGARLTAKESAQGRNPLHLAAVRGNLAVCECLVYNQGDLSARDEGGKNPVELARDGQHRLLHRVLRRLTRAGLGRREMGAGPRRVSLDAG
ncbi:ankyrin repeat domain-containing protein [bacterium]|nr:ankyrin repeat domain-containing protein [bacterium]